MKLSDSSLLIFTGSWNADVCFAKFLQKFKKCFSSSSNMGTMQQDAVGHFPGPPPRHRSPQVLQWLVVVPWGKTFTLAQYCNNNVALLSFIIAFRWDKHQFVVVNTVTSQHKELRFKSTRPRLSVCTFSNRSAWVFSRLSCLLPTFRHAC